MGYIHASGLAGEIARYRPRDPHEADEQEVTGAGLDLGFERQILNGTNKVFRVASRNGITFTVPPHPGVVKRNVLTLREKCFLGRDVLVDATSAADEGSAIGKVWASAINRRMPEGFGLVRTHSVITDLQEREFADTDTMYLKDYDLVISTVMHGRLVHPYSEEGEIRRHAEEMSVVSGTPEAGAGIVFELVDPHMKAGLKFVNLYGEVYRVPVVARHDLQEGLYVIRNGMSKGSMSFSPPIYDRYDLEDLSPEKIGFTLYDSVQEALSHGDLAKSLERDRLLESNKIKQMENEMRRSEMLLKAELRDQEVIHQQQQHEWSLEKMKLEQEKQRVTVENERRKDDMERMRHDLDMRSMERKDVYEQRSHERKDALEYLKFLPLALAAIMGIFVAFRK